MTHDADRIIAVLSPEIDRECAELRQTRLERRRFRRFLALCALTVLLPTVFVIFGISLTALLISAAFASAAFLILSPILIRQQGGPSHEQI